MATTILPSFTGEVDSKGNAIGHKEVRTITMTIYMQGIILFVTFFVGFGLAIWSPEEAADASVPATTTSVPKAAGK